MSEEARWLISIVVAIIVILLCLFIFNLIRTPVYIRFEEKMKPRLEIIGIRKQNVGAFGKGSGWGLMVKNNGIEPALTCRAIVEQIIPETGSKALDEWPINRPLHWAGQSEGMDDFTILGGQTARLGIIYLDYESGGQRNVITLAYRSNEQFRFLNYFLVDEPILLLLSITNEGTLPQYVVCRIDLEMITLDLVIEREDRPLFKIWCSGVEKPDLSEFIKSNAETEIS